MLGKDHMSIITCIWKFQPSKLTPSWQNNQLGDEGISKRLDKFCVSDGILAETTQIRSWVGSREMSKHSPISDNGKFPAWPLATSNTKEPPKSDNDGWDPIIMEVEPPMTSWGPIPN